MVFEMKKPQVFVSFRGKDERTKLLPHLRHHLEASPSNVNVFTDENVTAQPLERLFNHIRNSWLVIVIFSVSYLESNWCLNELVEIKRCLQTEKIKFALPIFYKVEAYEVKEQKGEFGANFRTLENSCPDMVKKWKKALEYVANYGGLTYQETSQLSELDFIKKVVEKVDQIFAKSPPNEIFDKSQLHLSKTLDALNLERSYFEGFMHGAAWKDLVSFVQSSNRFEIPLPESSIHQFPMNRQRFDLQAQSNKSLEDATNILALHMMRKQTQPTLIFSNWDKIDHQTKNYIIYSADMKSKMIKSNKGDVDLEPLFRSNFPPSVGELIRDKTLEPPVWPHHDHRRANSFHDSREQFYRLTSAMDWPVEPLVEPPVKPLVQPLVIPPVEPLAKPRVQLPVKPQVEPQGRNDNTGQRKVVPKRRDDNPGCFTSLCYCFKSCAV